MPSIKPRLALTLPQHRYDLLKRLAGLQGVSMASVVSELLDECYPVLERVVLALEAAQKASEGARSGLKDACDKALEELEPYRVAASDQFDMFMDGIMQKTEAAAGDSSAVEAKANPRVVTRGSGSTEHKPLNLGQPSNGKASRRSSKGGVAK